MTKHINQPPDSELGAAGRSVLASLSGENGEEIEISNEEFISLLNELTADEPPSDKTISTLKSILTELILFFDKRPKYITKHVDDQAAEQTNKALRIIYDFLLWREKNDSIRSSDQSIEAIQAETLLKGTINNVKDYVITKDLLSKAVFGETGRKGKKISIVSNTPGTLTLWTEGKGKKKQDVAVYTRLEFDQKALEAAGIVMGRNISKRGREAFGAMLSHILAGNHFLTLGMMGRIIFNSRSDNLTPNQKQYIIDGVTEVFGTKIYVNTAVDARARKKDLISVAESQKVDIKYFGYLFPGEITSGYINGTLIDGVIHLYDLPILYKLQKELDKSQILRLPIEALAIPGGRMDEDIITIRNYLMRRIDAMKHNDKMSRLIIYKNIMDEVGIDVEDRAQRTQKTRMLKKVERVLDYWKTYPGEEIHIKDYRKLTKTGQIVSGRAAIYEIEIIL